METMNPIYLALLVTTAPTVGMLVASYFLTKIQIAPIVEACFQNLAAGLILAAVGAELFPLLMQPVVSTMPATVGITVGFVVGIVLMNGTEVVVDKAVGALEGRPSRGEHAPVAHHETGGGGGGGGAAAASPPVDQSPPQTSTQRKKTDIPFDDIEEAALSMELKAMRVGNGKGVSSSSRDLLGDWAYDPVEVSSAAMAMPNHRSHLEEHLEEMHASVVAMESKAARLVGEEQLTQRATEEIAEQIDEAIHSLQYKLDHCRRLLEGSEIEVVRDGDGPGGPGTYMTIVRNNWVSDTRKLQIKGRLSGLRATARHLIEHVQESKIDDETLVEMHEHMAHFDAQLSSFHEQIETAAAKWRRSRPTTMPETMEGDTIPFNLVVPVVIDCFIDGFLIGIACAISEPAGVILGVANTFEMTFLGVAYSSRLTKCTGSSEDMRAVFIYVPPLIMFFSSGFGSWLVASGQFGEASAVFIGFVAFAVICLVGLVCGELLIEAREAQGENEQWWVNAFVFLGVYAVLIIDKCTQ